MKNNRLYKRRLIKAKFFGKLISKLPYVKTVMLTGSLAEGRAEKKSDIDIMIITQTARIFSARFFVNSFGKIIGIKRSKDNGTNHAGKFCFNYFVSEDYLKLPVGRGEKIDKYCARNYSKSRFLAGDVVLYQKFLSVNQYLFKKYGYSTTSTYKIAAFKTKTSRFERWAKKYQIKKIEFDPITFKYPALITYNDNELRFHPPK